MAAVYVIWGSTYLAIRVVVTAGLPPMATMGVRFITSGTILMTLLALRLGRKHLRMTREQLVGCAVVGAMLLLVGNGFVAVAETSVASGLAALLVSSTPLWLALLRPLFGERTRPLTIAGTLVGLGGVAILARPGGAGSVTGVLLIGIATLSWSTGSLLSGRLRLPDDPFVSAATQMLFAGGLLLLTGVLRGELHGVDLASVPVKGWLALVYLTTFGSLVAYTSYYWLLRNAPIQLVSTYAYVNPVVAVILGWLILAEQVTAAVAVGGAVAVLGVVLVITSERRPAASH